MQCIKYPIVVFLGLGLYPLKFRPYMKSIPWFSVYGEPEGHIFQNLVMHTTLCIISWSATKNYSLASSRKEPHCIYFILLQCVLTHLHCVLFAVYAYRSVFKIGVFIKLHEECILSCVWMTYQWGLDWRLDSLTTLTQYSLLHLIIVSLLISTLYKLLQHTLSLFSVLCLHQLFPGNGS
jgi:uncharacterized membrane protein YeiB